MKYLIFFCVLSFISGIFFSFQISNKNISKGMLADAAKVAGLEFDDDEIELMLADVENQRETFYENRKSKIENSVSPALVFNPLPKNFTFEKTQQSLNFSDFSKTKLPENREDLAFYSIGQLAHLLRTQQLTSVDLTRFFLDRLKKYNQKLHCVITFTEQRAMRQAKQADQEIQAGKYKGLLHGIPYGAKDLLAVEGYKTTWGAMPYKDQVIDETATVIKKLDDAGAVLIAKLTLGALAWGDVWFGEKTRNPWDTEQGSSGSSAGSAAAVAAGLVPFALGTETLGSIVSPATVCGATGLRPTFGRVSRHGAMALSWTMDKIGPLCRTVEDAAIVFETIRGSDGEDASVMDAPFNFHADFDLKKLRVGYVKSAFEQEYAFHHQDSVALADLRKLGVTLHPIELPAPRNLTFILEAEGAAAFDELTRTNRDSLLVRSKERRAWANVFRKARLIPAVEYINANRQRTQLIESMDSLMQTVDIYVHPSWASSSLRTTNLTGHPCVVLPNGFSENGTPTSITFAGKLFGEAELLAFAKAYQESTKHHLKHPDLD